ncbi:MAG: MFS transporter [Prolixibacteraceae bacterium]|jgi:MFS transporter, FHS family, L-fucose permease|nr:MFS transporter [Prolixibacteraceae bacterium]MBT6766464.1 MFS transporter [Prolixibacteraceae bacterium]MBT6998924.1 MFS transporter [Prolixibacteraceae bacterium]MBT7395119.1 MFS transporter [Prolixibacteraceae bacterium]
MNVKKASWGKLFPVFLSFIVMGFVDIIGVATGYIKQDFELTDFTVQFLPMMVLLWFFVLSVPAGILQDKYGKRNMLNIGMIVQAIGLGLPFIHYSFAMMFASFILLGIGNTIIQVSANPLLQDVSPAEKLASYMSTSQFVKAMVSFAGPLIATFLATRFGNWRLVFAVYGITSVFAAIWLSMTPIVESKPDRKTATFASCFGLLKNRFVAFMALAIFLIVGAEVAMNTNIANILIAKYGLTLEKAVIGISVFFAGETIARLLGAIILNWIKPRFFLLLTSILSLIGVVGVFYSPGSTIAFTTIFITGLGIGNMFPIIFSLALEKMPERANEISGLLIMAVSGGAVIPLVMGFVSTTFGPLASISVIGVCMLYIFWVSFFVRKG